MSPPDKQVLSLVGTDRLRATRGYLHYLQQRANLFGNVTGKITNRLELSDAKLVATNPDFLIGLLLDVEETVSCGSNPGGRRIDRFLIEAKKATNR